jgi:hypothetical protein
LAGSSKGQWGILIFRDGIFKKKASVITDFLKVSKNRNAFMKIPFGPKSNVIVVRISENNYVAF